MQSILSRLHSLKNKSLKYTNTKQYKQDILPILLLLLVLFFALYIRVVDMKWGIEDQPNFAYSTFEDESHEIRDTINLDVTDLKLSSSRELMIKGAFYHSLCKISYDLINNTFFGSIFSHIYGNDISSTVGTYYFLRSTVVLTSIIGIFLVYILATLVSKNKYTGVLSSFLFSTIFTSTYFSIFYKSSIPAVTSITLLLILCVSYIKKPTLIKSALLGLVYSMSFAIRFDTIFSITAIITIFFIQIIKEKKIPYISILSCLISSVVTLFIFAPYIFFNFQIFKKGIEIQNIYQTGRSFHFEGFGFQPLAIVTHLLSKGMGTILTILALLSVILAVYSLFKKKKNSNVYLPLLIYLCIHFIVISRNTWIVTRYTMVLFPALCTLISILIVKIYKFVIKKQGLLNNLGITVLTTSLVLHFFWFLAYNNLIREKTTTIKTTNWIQDNLPEGTVILNEAAQSGPAPVYGLEGFNIIELNWYGKSELILAGGSFEDYIVDYIIVSERSFRQFYRLDMEEYPEYKAFKELYDPLFDERDQKYTVIKKFGTDAKFMGITFDKGFLPQDLVIISPDIYLIKVNY